MRKLTIAAALLVPMIGLAQVQVDVTLPTIQFHAPPPLVVVSPGVQVVEDYDDEVYFVEGWYWVRRDQHWYRARDHHGGWAVVGPGLVPVTIVKMPVGKYRKYKMARRNTVVVPVKGNGGKHKHKHK